MPGEFTRSISNASVVCEPIDTSGITDDDALIAWLAKKAQEHELPWLLAHADDGVVWGRHAKSGGITTSHDAAPSKCPALRIVTLQQARLFGPPAEILLWRDENDWSARIIRDATTDEQVQWDRCYDEHQLLWGDHGTSLAHNFTLWEEGARGLRHAVPCALRTHAQLPPTPPRLWVRHYLARGAIAAVEISRLCGLTQGGKPCPIS